MKPEGAWPEDKRATCFNRTSARLVGALSTVEGAQEPQGSPRAGGRQPLHSTYFGTVVWSIPHFWLPSLACKR
jgi:hypothetical protein